MIAKRLKNGAIYRLVERKGEYLMFSPIEAVDDHWCYGKAFFPNEELPKECFVNLSTFQRIAETTREEMEKKF